MENLYSFWMQTKVNLFGSAALIGLQVCRVLRKIVDFYNYHKYISLLGSLIFRLQLLY